MNNVFSKLVLVVALAAGGTALNRVFASTGSQQTPPANAARATATPAPVTATLNAPAPRCKPTPFKAELASGAHGHYNAMVELNGTTIPMMIDTGASYLSLNMRDAQKIGLDVKNLNYSLTMGTANGLARAAPVRIAQVNIGRLVVCDVEAIVMQGVSSSVSLLGMSFLQRLKGFEFSSGMLYMRV